MRSSGVSSEKALIGAFGALIAFGCVLRFWKLGSSGFSYDELWTVVGAGESFGEMWRDWIVGDPHPPGYFLFYHVWLRLVPDHELWARLPNAIAGLLTVAHLLFGTRKVLSRSERIYAAALVSFSWTFLEFAVSVKQYSAMLLLATVATVLYLRISDERRIDSGTQTLLALSVVGLAYLNHFAMAYAWVLLALLAVHCRGVPEVLRPLRRVAVICAVAYLPVAFSLYFPLLYSANLNQSSFAFFVSELLPSLFFDDVAVVAAFLGVVVLGGVWRSSQLRSSRNRHLVALVGTFAALLAALSLVEPILVLRYFMVLFPIVLIGLAILMAAAFPMSGGWLAMLPLAFFARAAVVDFRAIDTFPRQAWRESVDLVLESAAGEDPVYVLGASPDRSMLDYLRAGDVDGVVYRKNVEFYDYYFRRRGAEEVATRLKVIAPTAPAAADLARAYRGSGRTVFLLAGHHIQFDAEALWNLEQAPARVEPTWLYSTIVYRVEF